MRNFLSRATSTARSRRIMEDPHPPARLPGWLEMLLFLVNLRVAIALASALPSTMSLALGAIALAFVTATWFPYRNPFWSRTATMVVALPGCMLLLKHLPIIVVWILGVVLVGVVIVATVIAVVTVGKQRNWSLLWAPPDEATYSRELRASDWLFPFLARFGVPLLLGGLLAGLALLTIFTRP